MQNKSTDLLLDYIREFGRYFNTKKQYIKVTHFPTQLENKKLKHFYNTIKL